MSRKKSSQIAVGGLSASLCLVLMLTSAIIPFGTYALPAAAGMALIPVAAEMGLYDCIFNTVPENVIYASTLARVKRGTPVIELASPPGGVDAAEAEKAGVRLVPAGGLPGKIMPRAAGKIIYEALKEMIDEEEKR